VKKHKKGVCIKSHACSSVVVEALHYKLEGRVFKSSCDY
jgi:hypothetical protein